MQNPFSKEEKKSLLFQYAYYNEDETVLFYWDHFNVKAIKQLGTWKEKQSPGRYLTQITIATRVVSEKEKTISYGYPNPSCKYPYNKNHSNFDLRQKRKEAISKTVPDTLSTNLNQLPFYPRLQKISKGHLQMSDKGHSQRKL